MDLIVVTGMSGAGKTQAINALEDMGYYCVDNVPPKLVEKFSELPEQSEGKIGKIALVVDVRSRELFNDFLQCLEQLRRQNSGVKTLFLDCADGVLSRRFRETRRRHPLLSEEIPSVERAIALERELLQTAKDQADFVLDTSYSSAAEMKNQIRELFSGGVGQTMMITIGSFGYKRGIPSDSDLVFNVRCLPNPFYVEELREQTGLDKPVREYVLSFPQATGLLPRLYDLVDYMVPLYIREGKSQLVISIGCTGGRHRSVVFAECLREHLKEQGYAAGVNHRDMRLPNKGI